MAAGIEELSVDSEQRALVPRAEMKNPRASDRGNRLSLVADGFAVNLHSA